MQIKDALSNKIEQMSRMNFVAQRNVAVNPVNVISLGYNCEVSQRIQDCFGIIDSFPWSWAYSSDLFSLLNVLQDKSYLLDSKYEVAWNGTGIRYTNPDMTFHIRGNVIENGKINEKELIYQKNELDQRLLHMMTKFENICNSEIPTTFLMKIPPRYVINKAYKVEIDKLLKLICDSISKIMKKKKDYGIVVVLSQEVFKEPIAYENPNLHIRYVSSYSHDNLTDIGGDIVGWYKIINEITPVSSKFYCSSIKSRLIKRRDTLTPESETLLKSLLDSNGGDFVPGITDLCYDDSAVLMNYCTEMAEFGNHSFERRMGQLYGSGEYCKKSLDLAIKWTLKSLVSDNSVAAMEVISYLLQRGDAKDYECAYKIAKKYAQKGDPNLCMRLSRLYATGQGVEKNMDEAITWMRRASEHSKMAKKELVQYLLERGSCDDIIEAYHIAKTNDILMTPKKCVLQKNEDGGNNANLKLSVLLMELACNFLPEARYDYIDYLIECGAAKDLDKAYKIAENYVDPSDKRLMIKKGLMHYKGMGTCKDLNKAIACIEQSIPKELWVKETYLSMLIERGSCDDIEKIVSVSEDLFRQGSSYGALRLFDLRRKKIALSISDEEIKQKIKEVSTKNVTFCLKIVSLMEDTVDYDERNFLLDLVSSCESTDDAKINLIKGKMYKNWKNDVTYANSCFSLALESADPFVVMDAAVELLKIDINDRLSKEKILELAKKNKYAKRKLISLLLETGETTDCKFLSDIVVSEEPCVVRSAHVINPKLLEYKNKIIVGTFDECCVLLCTCIQFNLRIEYAQITDEMKYPLPMLSSPKQDVLGGESTAYIYYDKKRKTNNSSFSLFGSGDLLLIRKDFYRDGCESTMQICDTVPDTLSRFQKYVICSDEWSDIYDSLIQKVPVENVYVDFVPQLCKKICYLSSPYAHSVFYFSTIDGICELYQKGREVYDLVTQDDVTMLLPCWHGLGDPCKIASLSEAYKQYHGVSKLGMISSRNNGWIPEVFKSIDKYVGLEKDSLIQLLFYIAYQELYNSGLIRVIGPWPLHYTHLTGATANLFYKTSDRPSIDHFKEYMNLPYSVVPTKIKMFGVSSKKILMIPNISTAFKQDQSYNSHTDLEIRSCFTKIVELLKTKGFAIYTNAPMDDDWVIPGTERFSHGVVESLELMEGYFCVISTLTGLSELMSLCDLPIYMIYPSETVLRRYNTKSLNSMGPVDNYILTKNTAEEIVNAISKVAQ